ncbi:hypothetical protein NPX13_g9698 [Xylaria arbuscula]|uniref:Uncharacterized protein n=1 Tax=Xylaria arbuscula TaxID=114810 RepID=A0A9W8N671_9PEZI|nr:hypothetical protein NPX13_g9698 [Xylaria arbuscula]
MPEQWTHLKVDASTSSRGDPIGMSRAPEVHPIRSADGDDLKPRNSLTRPDEDFYFSSVLVLYRNCTGLRALPTCNLGSTHLQRHAILTLLKRLPRANTVKHDRHHEANGYRATIVP